jgi:hypothetical protein
MKVFLGWSGDISHKVALALREWLPSVIQTITPYVSDDLPKGDIYFKTLVDELKNSEYGILCVTKENVNAPWLNFEAGALSMKRVSPFLLDIKPEEIRPPLSLIQATIFKKDDIKKLVDDLNEACGQGALKDTVEKYFKRNYPTLKRELNKIIKDIKPVPRGDGSIQYNLSIQSDDLNFPSLFGKFNKEIFLVGPNQNFILNLIPQVMEDGRLIFDQPRRQNFQSMIKSLESNKRILMLISPLDEKSRGFYDGVSDRYKDEILSIKKSIDNFDRLIIEDFNHDKLNEIKNNGSLVIKSYPMFFNSFCFVDTSPKEGRGYFMLVTKNVGSSRPPFYFDKIKDASIYNKYYGLYKNTIFEAATPVWPR